MITKIFYSLVLFPNIKYQEKLKSWYVLEWINEKDYWSLLLVFIKNWKTEEIIFKHIDFNKEKNELKTKNWIISGINKELLENIFEIVSKKDVSDFNFFKKKEFYDKIPFWTVLTITSKCNLFCNYCFNDYDYPLKNRNLRDNIWLEKYKKIVDILYKYGTRDIIITWWEPFSAPFLWDLLGYIRDKNIFIRINTNGTLLFDKTLERLNNDFSLNLMVSMHEFNNKDYYEINKTWAKNIAWIEWLKTFENKFEKKVIQLEKIDNFKNLSLDFLTILTAKNILYLDKIYDFILNKFNIEGWHFFRLYSTWTTKWISRDMINLAIHKLYKLNKKYNTDFKIVDSVPFCVTKNTEIAKQVIDWELSEHHNIKTIITTDWNIQIMSAFDTNLWSIFDNDLLEVWQWDYVQKMLKNWFLPKECFDCKYKEECRWWSRMDANIYNKSYSAFDPLWNINNKKVI
mgnify:CR=1 FL=1